MMWTDTQIKLNNFKSANFISFFITFSVIILIFQGNIASVFQLINYYDEIFTILIVIIWIMYNKGKVSRKDAKQILLLIILVVVGCCGNFISGINYKWFIMLVDALGTIKIFLVLITVGKLLSSRAVFRTISNLAFFLQLYVFAEIVFLLLAPVIGLDWMFTRERFGLKSYGFLNSDGWNAYYLQAAYCTFLMNKKKMVLEKTTKLLCLLLIFLTLKGPSLLFLVFLLYFHLSLNDKKMKWYHIVVLIFLGIVFGWWFIEKYLLTSGEARMLLNVTGFKIMKDYFPIGLGWGTFGSDISRDFYSDAYYMYGLNTVNGLGYNSLNFITDNYWAMVFGQLGAIGTVICTYLYYNLYKKISSKVNVYKYTKNAVLALFFSFMVGSIGSAYLTSHLGVSSFIIIGVFLSENYYEKES